MREFTELIICRERKACLACRSRSAGGVRFRQKMRSRFKVPDGKADWDCPFGIPWHSEGQRIPCPYEYPATEQVCRRCLAEPEFRMLIFSSWLRRKEKDLLSDSCSFRSRHKVAEQDKSCCGGKTKSVPLYDCSRSRRQVHVGDCSACPENSVFSLPEPQLREIFPLAPDCKETEARIDTGSPANIAQKP